MFPAPAVQKTEKLLVVCSYIIEKVWGFALEARFYGRLNRILMRTVVEIKRSVGSLLV